MTSLLCCLWPYASDRSSCTTENESKGFCKSAFTNCLWRLKGLPDTVPVWSNALNSPTLRGNMGSKLQQANGSCMTKVPCKESPVMVSCQEPIKFYNWSCFGIWKGSNYLFYNFQFCHFTCLLFFRNFPPKYFALQWPHLYSTFLWYKLLWQFWSKILCYIKD